METPFLGSAWRRRKAVVTAQKVTAKQMNEGINGDAVCRADPVFAQVFFKYFEIKSGL